MFDSTALLVIGTVPLVLLVLVVAVRPTVRPR
jgi:hypothetical protein